MCPTPLAHLSSGDNGVTWALGLTLLSPAMGSQLFAQLRQGLHVGVPAEAFAVQAEGFAVTGKVLDVNHSASPWR